MPLLLEEKVDKRRYYTAESTVLLTYCTLVHYPGIGTQRENVVPFWLTFYLLSSTFLIEILYF